MTFLKATGVAILSGLGGDIVGALLGMFLIQEFSDNLHDKAAEEATTGLLIVGPFVGLMSSFGGTIYFGSSRRS